MDFSKKLGELSDFLKKIKIPGTDMNLGEAVVDLSLTGFGTAASYWAVASVAPSIATGPVGGAVALGAGAWLAKEFAQASNVPAAVRDPTKFMIAGAALVILAAIFMPSVLFGSMPHYAGQALQSVITLVK